MSDDQTHENAGGMSQTPGYTHPSGPAGMRRRPTTGERTRRNGTKWGDKPDRIELDKRVDIVESLILQGHGPSAIRTYVAQETDWDVHPSTIKNYINKARARLAAQQEPSRQKRVGVALARYERLYAKAYTDKNWTECRKIQTAIDRLLGNDAPREVRHTGKDGGPIQQQDVTPQPVGRAPSAEQRATAIVDLLGLAIARGAKLPAFAVPVPAAPPAATANDN